MTRQEFDDETLMAYADGELESATARAIAAAEETDSELTRRIAVFSRTQQLLGEAGRSRPLEPISPEFGARVREALGPVERDVLAPETVVAFRRPAPAPAAYRTAAIAAGLALVVGLGGGFLVSQELGRQDEGGLRIASLEAPAIAQALDEVPSGQRVVIDGGEISTIASFRNADGEFCREFEYDRANLETVVSVACRSETGWQARFAVVAAGAHDTGYAPASSLETLDAYLGAIGAGAPLSLEEETAALEGLGG